MSASTLVQTHAQALLDADARREAYDDASGDGDDAAFDAIADAFDTAVGALSETRAQTLADLAAKAAAAIAVIHVEVSISQDATFDEQADPHERLALSLARDVLRFAEALRPAGANG
jgi:hypothetical protein